MSLDKLDYATTARWTVRGKGESLELGTIKTVFEQVQGCKAASLTKQTLNLSMDLEIQNADMVAKIDKMLKSAENLYGTEVISRNVPEI